MSDYQTTFNYLLTHQVIPQMVFSNEELFYETILVSKENFPRFLQQACQYAADFAEKRPEVEPAYPIEKFTTFVYGDNPDNGGVIVRLPKYEEVTDCAEIAFPFSHRRYFTLELSNNPLDETEWFPIVGEWERSGEGLTHHNYGQLDSEADESFPQKVQKILGVANGNAAGSATGGQET